MIAKLFFYIENLFMFWFFPGATTDEPLANNSLYGVEYTKSFPCPVGYYCKSGDVVPTACPNKTYNSLERRSRKEDCLLCQVDHYNHLTGQPACFHCGGQAKQPYLGQDRCQCNGLHRVFMVGTIAISDTSVIAMILVILGNVLAFEVFVMAVFRDSPIWIMIWDIDLASSYTVRHDVDFCQRAW